MTSSIRPAFAALWDLDLALADVVSTSSDPRLGAIRLAWWRERLEQLDGGSAPAEPRLQAVVAELVPRGVTGAELSTLEDAWLPMFDAFPWGAAQVKGFGQRGRLLFGIGARLLRGDAAEAEPAGVLWSLQDGAVHCSDSRSRELLTDAARQSVAKLQKVGAKLRPMTILAALAAADVLHRARGKAALAHRLLGTMPRH